MLKIENLCKTFHKGEIDEKKIFDDLNISINDGEFIIILGGNGAGKSTLMNIIAGSLTPDSGKIFLDDKDITNLPEYKRAKFIGRVFQDPLKGTSPNLTIEENLSLAMLRTKRRTLSLGINKKNKDFFKEKLFELNLGLEDRLNAKIGLLSGGQRQAVTLLMATIVKPKILLLDEHTAALDPKSQDKILDLTNKIVSDNLMITIMITHNMNHINRFSSRIIKLENGKVASSDFKP